MFFSVAGGLRGVVFALCSALFLEKKFLAVFQQTSYRAKEYFRKLPACAGRRLAGLFLLALSLAVLSVIAAESAVISAVLLSCFAFVSAAFSLFDKTVVGIVYTARMKRVFVTGAVVYSLAGGVSGTFLPSTLFFLLPAFVCFCPVVPALGCLPWLPYDRLLRRRAIAACTEKIAGFHGLIRIGITGSCGKTSVKNYLAKMLSEKYEVLATPKSFNTPLGICRTAEKLDGSQDVFLVEMGARRRGDIAELCRITKPQIAVMTAVVGQHLETFRTVEEIRRTKYELIESVGEKGYAVFSADSPLLAPLFRKAPCEKISVGFRGDKSGVRAENYRQRNEGSEFDLYLRGKPYRVRNALIGRHNATDVCLAAAVALRLGVAEENIVRAACSLKPVEHRMAVSVTAAGVTVIDDGYNANAEGIASGAECLDRFEGKKIVVTPGVTELGRYRREYNEKVGEVLASHADLVVAVGRNGRPIEKGADGKCAVRRVRTLARAKEVLKETGIGKGDVVLFLSDLPDAF
ncbi:MAG: Mur ligase family protein [Candidatus Borkfalkiaceae bacterium]|nr:Mur ligase family protein [Christensenellaceae bacterium]